MELINKGSGQWCAWKDIWNFVCSQRWCRKWYCAPECFCRLKLLKEATGKLLVPNGAIFIGVISAEWAHEVWSKYTSKTFEIRFRKHWKSRFWTLLTTSVATVPTTAWITTSLQQVKWMRFCHSAWRVKAFFQLSHSMKHFAVYNMVSNVGKWCWRTRETEIIQETNDYVASYSI